MSVSYVETLDNLFQLPFYPPSLWKTWNTKTPPLPNSLAVDVILPIRPTSRRLKSRNVAKVTWMWVSCQDWCQHSQGLVCGWEAASVTEADFWPAGVPWSQQSRSNPLTAVLPVLPILRHLCTQQFCTGALPSALT